MNRYLAGFALLGFLALPSSAQVPGMFQPLLIQATAPPIGTPVNIGTLNTGTTLATTYTITTTGAVVSGDALVFSAVNYKGGGAANITSISDGTNSYTFANRQVFSNQTTEQWYVCGASAVGSSATVTVTFAGGATSLGAVASISRVTGILTSACLDVAPAGSAGTSTSGTVSTGTLAQANEIIFGAAGINNCPTYTEASGFTSTNTATICNAANGTTLDQAYKKVSATTTTAFAPSWSTTQLYGLLVISLKGF